MSLSIDFLAIITQFALNLALIVSLIIYLLCTATWESVSTQEEEAEKQFLQLRANLAKR